MSSDLLFQSVVLLASIMYNFSTKQRLQSVNCPVDCVVCLVVCLYLDSYKQHAEGQPSA